MNFKKIVAELTARDLTIATMESCTGGFIASSITDCEGASEVLKFSAVTYCNEYKIKMGVSKEVISKYSVYSIETAEEMAKNISIFSHSDIGIGITGKLNRIDPHNQFGAENEVFVSIYFKKEFHNFTLKVEGKNREENKKVVRDKICEELEHILEKE